MSSEMFQTQLLRQIPNFSKKSEQFILHFRIGYSSSANSSLTSPSLLRFCGGIRILQQVHARFILQGLHQNPSLNSDLIVRYAELGHLDISRKLFGSVVKLDSFIHNTVIKTMLSHQEPKESLLLYKEMVRSLCLDEVVYPLAIKACIALSCIETGEMIHCHAIKFGFDSFPDVCHSILGIYDQRATDGSQNLLNTTPQRSVASWNALIFSSIQKGGYLESFKLFDSMRAHGIHPNPETVASLLQACRHVKNLEYGKIIHALTILNGFGGILSVSTDLIKMYSELRCLWLARLIFEDVKEKDHVAWNVMISGYGRSGFPELSLSLMVEMKEKGFIFDLYTAIASLSSAANLRSLKLGREIHGHVIRSGSACQVSVHNALIDMYCQCNNLSYARKIFDALSNKTVISWSLMIKGYLRNDRPYDALILFDEMKMDGIMVDFITLINILPACVRIGALRRVENIHSYVIKQGLNSIMTLVTALLTSYAKCGHVAMARKLFDENAAGHKDVVTWNSIIDAYSKHGMWSHCLGIYNQMKNLGITPDKFTYAGLLTVCVNLGLVKEGMLFFNEMVQVHNYQPELNHYARLVDLLGRAGHLNEALNLINAIPYQPDVQIWGSLLNACRLHSNSKLADFVAKKVINLEPENPGNYILVSNINADAHRWDIVAKMRRFLRRGSMGKIPGCSWLEIHGEVHEFYADDLSCANAEGVCLMLRLMDYEIKGDKEVILEEKSSLFYTFPCAFQQNIDHDMLYFSSNCSQICCL